MLVRQLMFSDLRLRLLQQLGRLLVAAPDRSAHADRRAAEQARRDGTAHERRRIAARNRQRLAERLLERMAQDETKQQRRLRNVELAERVTHHAKEEREEQVEHIGIE